MEFLLVSALVVTSIPETLDATATRDDIPAETLQLEPVAQTQATCPTGQFPSAFPDVYPTDWAYQAVNRLASRTVQCFDLPVEKTSIR